MQTITQSSESLSGKPENSLAGEKETGNFFINNAEQLLWELPSVVVSSRMHVSFINLLSQFKNQPRENAPLTKLVRISNRYYAAIHEADVKNTSGNTFNVLKCVFPKQDTSKRAPLVVSIPGKSPFNENYFYLEDELPLSDIKEQVNSFLENGGTSVVFTGNEPMMRLNDIIKAVKGAKTGADFWLVTAGFNFTQLNAQKLKKAGLTGIIINLDLFSLEIPYKPEELDRMFHCATETCINAYQENLIVGLTLTASKEFVTEDNLMYYAHAAKKLGVAFIQLQKPVIETSYVSEEDNFLTENHQQVIDSFSRKINFDPTYKDWPIVLKASYSKKNQNQPKQTSVVAIK